MSPRQLQLEADIERVCRRSGDWNDAAGRSPHAWSAEGIAHAISKHGTTRSYRRIAQALWSMKKRGKFDRIILPVFWRAPHKTIAWTLKP